MKPSSPHPIDFTGMYAAHDSFRRDLTRLMKAADTGHAPSPQVRSGWENFKHQLLLHHRAEDTDLWPRLHDAVAGQAADLALVQDMIVEHGQLDPLLHAIDQELEGDAAGLAARTRPLATALHQHLLHEENSALPLIQSALTQKDWRRFTNGIRRRQGIKGAAVYLPWVLDGDPTDAQRQFVAAIPAPLRLINRLFWQPRYHKRSLWATHNVTPPVRAYIESKGTKS